MVLNDFSPHLIHEKSVEILTEVGFCVPEGNVLFRLECSDFIVDHDHQMVRLTPEMVESALESLPKNVKLYNRSGETPLAFGERSSFMDAGTPVNVIDLETSVRRAATRQDVCDLVALQDALDQVDNVRPTVTATDQGESSI
jgi:trimethylamine:corrinoid methyltransferase-like protein